MMDRREMSRQYSEAGYAPVQYSNPGLGGSSSKKQPAPHTPSGHAEGMSKTIMDRLHDRRSRFAGINLSERDIEEILGDAAQSLDMDLSGASLVEDIPYFVADCISRNSYFDFVHVNLNSTSMSQKGYEILMELIVQCRDLETLSLRNNALQQDAGMALAKVVGSKGKLRILDVSDNFLGDSGLAVIAGALTADLSSTKHLRSSLLSLQVMDLSSNHIGDTGLLALCRGLIHFAKHLASIDKISSLKVLKLDKNNLGEKSALCLSQLFQTCREIGSLRIEELSLNDNPIGPAGISALFHAVARRGKTGEEVETAAYDFENNIDDLKRRSGRFNEDDMPDRRLLGGSLLILHINRCRPDISVLEEFSSLLRHGSLLKTLEMSMTRHVARDVSQQPGFVETVVTLAEAVANNVALQALELGDLGEVCNTAAVIAAPSSYQLTAIKRAIDALNSVQTLLRLDTAQQRLNWYAKHYFGGSDDYPQQDLMETLAPLKVEESQRRPRDDSPPRVARSGTGAPEAVSMHRAEFEKIRREHVDAFSELSSQIQELQHGKLRDVEDSRFEDSLLSRPEESPRAQDSGGAAPSHPGNNKIPGLHYSHARSVGSSDRVPSPPGTAQSNRGSASPGRRRADGTRLYDEQSVQALIKAAVNSALQFADKNGMRSPDHTLGSSLGQTAAVEQAIAPTSTSQALHELLSSRLSIMEDRIEGVEVLQLSQMNDTVPMEKFLAVQSMAAKLDGRLKVVEEYMVRSDAEKRLEEEKTQKDQTALKEYIIKMEENQRALLSRLQELEATLEGDSMTSIGLLDMLLKKIGSGGVVMGENETSAPPDRERSRSPSPPQNRRSGNNNRRAINR